jgi:O-acetyl-ADP-ribose deacetylase (regulator of RNase III)
VKCPATETCEVSFAGVANVSVEAGEPSVETPRFRLSLHMKIHQAELTLVRGSIVEQPVDAIVNAADTDMRGGGGIDGAVHRAAGIELIRELEKVAPNGAKTAQVVVTRAHKLPQQWVFHVAGPIWDESKATECDELLARCYRGCLEEAHKRSLESLALPSLSTGEHRFPAERAATIAVQTVSQFLQGHPETTLLRVVLVMFGGTEFYYFKKAVGALEEPQS